METILHFFRTYPEMAIFLTIGIGFWLGQLKYKSFSLGTVTSVLLVGVVVGQMDIPIPGPVKSVFFLLFLFSIGYSVGPQFFQSLKSDGIPQVIFACVLCILCLGVTVIIAKILGYNPGETIGLFAGAQTISAVIGVGTDTIGTFGVSESEKQAWLNIIPVCYAVTYIYGTIGSAYILGTLGPKMLGGLEKVKQKTRELEAQMRKGSIEDDPALIDANRPVVFRAYCACSDWFDTQRTVADVEKQMQTLGRRIFVERVRSAGKVVDATPDQIIHKNDELVLSGRRETVIEDESWIGDEVNDPELLTFPVEDIFVMLTQKTAKGKTIRELRRQPFMHGIIIKKVKRTGVELPILANTKLQAGDLLEIAISLSTSGGALILGLFFGWLRTKHPTFGRIPDPAVWIFNNLGLNMFIAVIGITAGPTFLSGIKEMGFIIFFAGILSTSIPLILGIWIGDKIFKFHPAINLGCNAGSRTTTAALGAIQESIESTVPALGYTVTYAVGNTLLILWGVVIVLLMS